MLAAAVVRAGACRPRRSATRGGSRPLQLTTVQTLVGTGPVLRRPRLHHLPMTPARRPWLQLVYLALFCSVFAFLAQTWAVRRTSASRASLLLGTEPVWAVAIGIRLAGERLALQARSAPSSCSPAPPGASPTSGPTGPGIGRISELRRQPML